MDNVKIMSYLCNYVAKMRCTSAWQASLTLLSVFIIFVAGS